MENEFCSRLRKESNFVIFTTPILESIIGGYFMRKPFIKVVGEKETLKQKLAEFSYNFGVWWDDNKEWAVIVLPAALGLTGWVVKTVVRGTTTSLNKLLSYKNLQKEQMLKDLYCYDRSLGHYWKLNRKVTNAEWLMISDRKRNGETLATILSSMKLI